jgi:hypothetical protein
MEGLDAVVGWVARRRRWNRRQAQAVFATAAVVGAVALSGYVVVGKLPAWRDTDAAYTGMPARGWTRTMYRMIQSSWLATHLVSGIILTGGPWSCPTGMCGRFWTLPSGMRSDTSSWIGTFPYH